MDFLEAKRWDARFEQDLAAGNLDQLGKKADAAFESGQSYEALCISRLLVPLQIAPGKYSDPS